MYFEGKQVLAAGVVVAFAVAAAAQTAQRIDLAERLAAGQLKAVNRQVTKLQGSRDGVHVSQSENPGLVWIEGSDFGEGTIEVDVRGRDVLQHAVQYMASPDYDWPRLRKEFPEEFEHPVDPLVAPTDWVPLRIVVKGSPIQVYVGAVKSPTLEARKLGRQSRGLVGLWTGNNSDGDFANLRIAPMK